MNHQNSQNNTANVFKILEAKAAIEEALSGATDENTHCILRSLKDQSVYLRRHVRDHHVTFVPAAELTLDVLIKTESHLIHFYINITIRDAVNTSKDLLAMFERDNGELSYDFKAIDNDYGCAELTDFDASENIKLWEVYDRNATITEIVDGAGKYISRDYEPWEKELNERIVAHFKEIETLSFKGVKKHILDQSKAQAVLFLDVHQITKP